MRADQLDMGLQSHRNAAGITALQMDIKIGGINAQIMAEALEQARKDDFIFLADGKDFGDGPREAMSVRSRIIQIKINSGQDPRVIDLRQDDSVHS